MENKGYINHGHHYGNVQFIKRISPPKGHKNAVNCPECEQITWKHSPECVHCGYEVKEHFYQRELAINIGVVRYRLIKKAIFMLVCIVFFYWLTWTAKLPSITPMFLILGLMLVMKPELEKDSDKLDMLRKEQKIYWHKSKFFEKHD